MDSINLESLQELDTLDSTVVVADLNDTLKQMQDYEQTSGKKTRKRRQTKETKEKDRQVQNSIEALATSIVQIQNALLGAIDEKAMYRDEEADILFTAWKNYLAIKITTELKPEVSLLLVQVALLLPRLKFVKGSWFKRLWQKIKRKKV